MDTPNNVILFPNSPVRETINSKEDVDERIELLHSYHIDETIEAIAHVLFSNLDIAGFNLIGDDENLIKDRVFIMESIKSVLYNKYNIYHPFQKIKENVFTNEEDGIGFADSLNLNNLVNNESKKREIN